MCAFMLPMDQLSLFRTAVSVTAFKNGHFGTLDSVTVLYLFTIQEALLILVGS